jgi:hypothetical protein
MEGSKRRGIRIEWINKRDRKELEESREGDKGTLMYKRLPNEFSASIV